LPLTDGRDVLIADGPRAFAEAVLRVLDDRSLARRLGSHAAAKVRKDYAWDRVAECFVNLCEEACKSAASRIRAAWRPRNGAALLAPSELD
jgi:polysaccharide biosynthesis protein PslH